MFLFTYVVIFPVLLKTFFILYGRVEKSKTRLSLLPESIGKNLVVKYNQVVLLNVSKIKKSHVDPES